MSNNENLTYNPTVQQLRDAFCDNNCEVWFVEKDGCTYQSNGSTPICWNLVQTVYIKRKLKIVLKYGDFEFTKEELPQGRIDIGKEYFFIGLANLIGVCRWENDYVDYKRAACKNVFLTEKAARKWRQMILEGHYEQQ